MAYDEQLAQRIRELLAERVDVDERKMFGSLAVLVGGNMACGVRGEDLLVRMEPEAADELLESEPGVHLAVMGARTMSGWLQVEAAAVAEDADLERWVRRGEEFGAGLPPK
jgi:TfoX/Sxy family transcriptional regulator of competence genes